MTSLEVSSRGGLFAAVVLCVAGGGVWWLCARTAPPMAPPASAARVPPPAVQPESAAPATPAVPPQPKASGRLLYAGGQEAPALNGVTEAVRLEWAGPWSPIKDRVVSNGWEWYLHEDGSYSTTRMIDMNGVPQAMALRAQPTSALPVFDEAALQRELQKAQGAGAVRR